MSRSILYSIVSGLMAASLVLAACSPVAAPATPAAPTALTPPPPQAAPPQAVLPPAQEKPQQEAVKPAAEAPKYGGTLTQAVSADPVGWDPLSGRFYGDLATALTNQWLWAGDWAKGPAGGYGTNDTDWGETGYDVWEQKAGLVAETTTWTVDSQKDQGTIVYQIRQGIHYSLNPNSEASRLVNGRELTADDVVFTLKTYITDTRAQLYQREPTLRTANITKTGPREVTVRVPLAATAGAILRFGNLAPIIPPEVLQKYGALGDWKRLVGTGGFMLMDYIPGSLLSYTRNSNFWMKDPVGPGKGNQLPYIDNYKQLIIPDASTRLAALRTGKVDRATLGWEDAVQMKKTTPALIELERPGTTAFAIKPRVDKPPFNDVRVRRAMMMAVDFNAINKSLNDGRGQILNYPIPYYPAYADIYLSLDDPAMPASVKELYTYNPEKARQLLKDAGYPNGLKTTALMTSTEVDLYSVYKDMWAKVGVDLQFDIREAAALTAIIARGDFIGMTRNGASPIASWFGATDWTPGSSVNPGGVNDPVVNEAVAKISLLYITDQAQAKRQYKELLKYALDQAYGFPVAASPLSVFRWPWLKNISAEVSVGYLSQPNWIQWVWLDQSLKKSMGY